MNFILGLLFMANAQAQTTIKVPVKPMNWKYCTAKYEVSINSDGEEMAGNISIRMKSDSVLWFSVSAVLGIQIMKGIIRKDSAFLLDLYNKKYYAYSLKDLESAQSLPSNILALQNIFMGYPADSFCSRIENSNTYYGIRPPYYGMQLLINDSNLTQTKFIDKGVRTVQIDYSNRDMDLQTAIPRNIVLDISDQRSALKSIRIKMALKTARFDAIPSYPFSVPDGYEHVDAKKSE